MGTEDDPTGSGNGGSLPVAGTGRDQGEATTGSHAEALSNLVPVSASRIGECLDSARFWVDALPAYADQQQTLADRLALTAGIVSAFSGLAIWPIVTADPTLGKLFASSLALVAAVAALIPRIKNYGESAGHARELTSRYGSLLGDLEDLQAAILRTPGHRKESVLDPALTAPARELLKEFEATKQKKDALRGLPNKQKALIELAALRKSVADAERHAADAQFAALERLKASDAERSLDAAVARSHGEQGG